MHNVRGGFDVVVKVVHEMGTVTFDMPIRIYGAKDDFGELPSSKWKIRNSATFISLVVA